MQTILFNILLILTVIWLLVGILFLWQQLHIVRQKVEEESKKKNQLIILISLQGKTHLCPKK